MANLLLSHPAHEPNPRIPPYTVLGGSRTSLYLSFFIHTMKTNIYEFLATEEFASTLQKCMSKHLLHGKAKKQCKE